MKAGAIANQAWDRTLETPVNRNNTSQMTGNAGLYYAAWHLSRRGWHVMPTVRNARGSDLIITNADETRFIGIQSKALSKRYPVPLGKSLETLTSDWWVITTLANTDAPRSYILALQEVRALAYKDLTGGAHWLQPRRYDQPEFLEAWHRIV